MQKPLITKEYPGQSGVTYLLEYFECDYFDHLPQDEVKQCYAVAFHGDKIVIVHNGKKDTWGLVGGSVEDGETFEETLAREVQEESNMKVISQKPLGYQKVTDMDGSEKPFYQLRYFAIVEPYGAFESDPDMTIDEMLEVDPSEYKKYFDWLEIGDAIIDRAMEFKKLLK